MLRLAPLYIRNGYSRADGDRPYGGKGTAEAAVVRLPGSPK